MLAAWAKLGIIAPMITSPRFIFSLLLVSGSLLVAQDSATPAAADAPAAAPQSEMQKWIATTDEGWQAAFKRDVTDAHEAEVNKLKLQYLNLLEEAVAKASKASDLDGAVALRNEQKRFSDTEFFPETDEAGDAAVVKQTRAALRALLMQAEKNRTARAKALLAKYDAFLADAQARLTKAQRLDDALLVKGKREEVAKFWSGPGVATAGNAAPPAPANPATAQSGFPPRTATTKPAAPAKPAVSPNIAATGGDPKSAIVGIWRFSWDKNGWNEARDFKADGTFTIPENGKEKGGGKWEVAGNKIIVTYSGGGKDEMVLPLDPSGTKVLGKRGREMKAVKEK